MDNTVKAAAVAQEAEVELGLLLHLWRAKRGMSQLDLATAAEAIGARFGTEGLRTRMP